MTMQIGRLATRWWQALQPSEDDGPKRRGDRGALARLRRCASVNQAVFEPATHELCRVLGAKEFDLDRVALIAAVLAHVRKNDASQKVPRQIGRAGETALMSELRFRRLLQADTADDQLTGFRRLAALVGGSLNVSDLAAALWRWDENDRRRWVYAYYDAPQAATPAADIQPTESAPVLEHA